MNAQRGEKDIQVGCEKTDIFEDDQPEQIDPDSKGQSPQAGLVRVPVDHLGQKEIRDDGDAQNKQVNQPAPGIEHQRKDQQHHVSGPCARHEKVACKEQRQKIEKEGDRRKDHAEAVCL